MSLPIGASRLPLMAVMFGLRAWESTRKPREFAMRRGMEMVQIAAHTPLGRLLPAPVPGHAPQAEAEAVRIAADARTVTEQLSTDEPKDRSNLPIADFDHITLGSLRARLRALSVEELAELREWEQSHGHRLPVLTLLDNRIAKLAADGSADSAYPSDPQTGT